MLRPRLQVPSSPHNSPQNEGSPASAFHLSIWYLLAIIMVLALGMAGWRQARNQDWGAGEVTTLALGSLLISNVLAWFQKDRWQVVWVGYGLGGWGYLVLALESPLQDHLPTSWLLAEWHRRLQALPPVDDFGIINNRISEELVAFRWAGHSLIALLLAGLSGIGAAILGPSKSEACDESQWPDGSLLAADWRTVERVPE